MARSSTAWSAYSPFTEIFIRLSITHSQLEISGIAETLSNPFQTRPDSTQYERDTHGNLDHSACIVGTPSALSVIHGHRPDRLGSCPDSAPGKHAPGRRTAY